MKEITLGPSFVANAVGNLAAPAAAGAGAVGHTAPADRLTVTRVRLINRTASPVTGVSLFVGATGAGVAGTEFLFAGISIPANSHVEAYCNKVLEGANGFLTGVAGTATAIVFEADARLSKA